MSVKLDKRVKKWVHSYRDYSVLINGKAKQRHDYYATKKEAEKAQREWKAQNPTIQTQKTFITRKPLADQRINLFDCIHKYRAEVQKTPNTMSSDKAIFKSFYTWSYKKGLHYPSDFDVTLLEQYQQYLYHERGLKKGTIDRAFSTIGSFFNHLSKARVIERSPCEYLSAFKPPLKDQLAGLSQAVKVERVPWSEDLFNQIFEASRPWMKSILLGLKETGCRPGELSRMRVLDLDLDANVIRNVRSIKGGILRERVVYLSEALREHLAREIKTHHANTYFLTPDDRPLFPSARGLHFDPHRLALTIQKTRVKLGIREKLIPYGLRHAMATDLVKAGVDLSRVAKVMGHSRTSTTEQYTHLENNDLAGVLELRKLKKIGGVGA